MSTIAQKEFVDRGRCGMIQFAGAKGDHRSLSEAIAVAMDGDLIIMDEQLPEEDIVIDRPLTIRGGKTCVLRNVTVKVSDAVLENVQIKGELTLQASVTADLHCVSMETTNGIRTLPDTGKKKRTIYLCGDSTMCEYDAARAPRTGWGQALRGMMDDWNVINTAVGGRSTKSFADEGRFDRLVRAVRPGDMILVQFGHNDEKDDPTRHTDPYGSYIENLRAYICLAREKGAKIVLLTSMARRRFDENGVPMYTHGEYPAAMKKLGAEEQVPVIDMEEMTMHALKEAGVEGSKRIHMWLPEGHPHYPAGEQDNSHLSREGAELYAGLVLKELRTIL